MVDNVRDLPLAVSTESVSIVGRNTSQGDVRVIIDRPNLPDFIAPIFSRRGMFGLANVAGATGALSTDRTWGTKFQIPARSFSAVRIGIRNSRLNTVNCKGLVGSTETADFSTAANQAGCVVNGSRVDTVDGTADYTGWQTLKVAGSASITLAAATSLASPVAPSITWTDWVPLQSVPRADGGTGALIQIRLWYQGTVTNYSVCSSVAALQATAAANRGFLAQTVFVDGDAIASPALAMATTPSFMCPVVIEFMSKDILASVGVVGDSLSDSVGSVADNRTNWLLRACGDISTPNAAVLPVNFACSGTVQDEFWSLAQLHMAQSTPDILVFEAVSPNGSGAFSPSTPATLRYKHMALYRNQIYNFLRYCRTNRIVPILMTGCPNEGYNTAAWDLERRSFQAELVNSGVLVFNSWAALGNGASPELFNATYKLNATHPNETGVEYMAQQFAPVLRQALTYVHHAY